MALYWSSSKFQNAITLGGGGSATGGLGLCEGVILAKSALEAAENAEALILATEWEEFQNIDFVQVRKIMHTPIIFDGRNLFDPRSMDKFGFRYFAIGRSGAPL